VTDFLAGVLDEQRSRVALLRGMREELRGRSRARAGRPRDLGAAVRSRRAAGCVAVIAEVKRRSPAAGELASLEDPAGAASRYVASGAAAISVLTETRHFGGTLEDLERVAGAVEVPVLRKDFLVDEVQLLEAHASGADAVLLIADALDARSLRGLLETAGQLGLGALVESHEEEALDRAIACGAEFIGINRRDLHTLLVDPERIARCASRVPADRLLVAESGLRSADDVRALPSRVDAVLIGTALVTAASPDALIGEIAAVRRAEMARP